MSHTKPIDLGRKRPDDIHVMQIPDPIYPELHLDTDDARLLDMPEEGTCEIHYKIVHRTHSEDKREGKNRRRCSITMEVRKLEPGHDPKFNGNKKKDYDGGARKAFSDYFKDK